MGRTPNATVINLGGVDSSSQHLPNYLPTYQPILCDSFASCSV